MGLLIDPMGNGSGTGAGAEWWRRRLALWCALIALALALGAVSCAARSAGPADRSDAEDSLPAATTGGVPTDVYGGVELAGHETLVEALDAEARSQLSQAVSSWLANEEKQARSGAVEQVERAGGGYNVKLDLGGDEAWFYWNGSYWDNKRCTEPAQESLVDLSDEAACESVFGEEQGLSLARGWASWASARGIEGRALLDFSSAVRTPDSESVSFKVSSGAGQASATWEQGTGPSTGTWVFLDTGASE